MLSAYLRCAEEILFALQQTYKASRSNVWYFISKLSWQEPCTSRIRVGRVYAVTIPSDMVPAERIIGSQFNYLPVKPLSAQCRVSVSMCMPMIYLRNYLTDFL